MNKDVRKSVFRFALLSAALLLLLLRRRMRIQPAARSNRSRPLHLPQPRRRLAESSVAASCGWRASKSR